MMLRPQTPQPILLRPPRFDDSVHQFADLREPILITPFLALFLSGLARREKTKKEKKKKKKG